MLREVRGVAGWEAARVVGRVRAGRGEGGTARACSRGAPVALRCLTLPFLPSVPAGRPRVMVDYYEALGVSRNATADDIKKA